MHFPGTPTVQMVLKYIWYKKQIWMQHCRASFLDLDVKIRDGRFRVSLFHKKNSFLLKTSQMSNESTLMTKTQQQLNQLLPMSRQRLSTEKICNDNKN